MVAANTIPPTAQPEGSSVRRWYSSVAIARLLVVVEAILSTVRVTQHHPGWVMRRVGAGRIVACADSQDWR
jgi:hypothetical protein